MWQSIKKVIRTILFVFYFILVMLLFLTYTLAHPMLKNRYKKTRNPNHHPNKLMWDSFSVISKLFGRFVS